MTDLEAIDRKLELIIDALGLSGKPRLSPEQMDEKVKSDILKFRQKRSMKNDDRAQSKKQA